jgi:hypothetical protein
MKTGSKYFCDHCGCEITTDSDRYNVIFRDRTEKTDKTEMHLCAADIKLVNKMKFAPCRATRSRKEPKWFNIKVAHLGKENTLYMIPDYQTVQVLNLKHEGLHKPLRKYNGMMYWTKEEVLYTINHTELAKTQLLAWNRMLFQKQTEDEKKDYETKHHNNVGFNKSDAKFMSAMAKITFDKSDDAITDAQYETLKNRFTKYAQQVADLLNEEL